ncbi:hypothetical protein ALP58_101805 [Pseudomonas savastanoi]|uniref:Uncharacterized protein n=4 Tax=Pseudomonas syringae group TaxID=136849 RepID=A0A3M5FLI5_PSESS|nr:hypothetical protein ALO79_100426 [Pseudomonas syringae pv. castaneae]KPX87939.1 hypothetical protein ALO64_100391 [Pseudomonas meliae]KPX89193.1 hypothetical protein ALO62_102135 [Pseudomonas amygdali pv. myricae]KPY46081.1 hypothetical protein ALO49_101762 [Pseudomonas savastanoi pv. retacarpa]RMO18784.1 hypothetical protein ALQ45_101599 [Pseudomonas amygdali pv. morsprunorum]RMR62065.1 hypothetical protein ALP82_101867 [Pseudomonas savastanoi pv. fraxini]RMS74787.1 hypothetical protein 
MILGAAKRCSRNLVCPVIDSAAPAKRQDADVIKMSIRSHFAWKAKNRHLLDGVIYSGKTVI